MAIPLSEVLPDPNEIVQDLLQNLLLAAAQRIWHRATREPHATPPLTTASLGVLSGVRCRVVPGIDERTLQDLLQAPEVVRLTERMLAAELLHYRRTIDQHRPSVQGPHLPSVEHAAIGRGLSRELRRICEIWFRRVDGTVEQQSKELFSALAVTISLGAKQLSNPFGIDHLAHELDLVLTSGSSRLRVLERTDSLAEILDFESHLRVQVANHHAWLRAPHLGRYERLVLADSYVSPRFRLAQLAATANRSRVTHPFTHRYASFTADLVLASLDRMVILGDPGAGKSSFGSMICHRLASNADGRSGLEQPPVPVFVSLRAYAAKATAKSLTEHLDDVCRSVYGMAPPPDAIQFMLGSGRMLVVFDGLDELAHVSDRRSVRDAVEAFAELWPMTRVVITARTIGYEHASIRTPTFGILELAEFDDDQVADYAHRWFASLEFADLDPELLVAAFLRESSAQASDLRRNPLLLTLLCALYTGEGSLPASRPVVYQRCVELLLRQWDAVRHIKVDAPLGTHLERTLKFVAYWAFTDIETEGGIPRTWLVARAASYLAEKRTGDLEDARLAAESFVEFCSDRAWILVEVGTSATNEPLFAFAHQTFMEYLAAGYIDATSASADDLAEKLMISTRRRDASILPQLALQIADRSREDGADAAINALLDIGEDESRDDGPGNSLVMLVDTLAFVVPKPATTARIVGAAIGAILDWKEQTGEMPGSSRPFQELRLLGRVDKANVRAAARGISQALLRERYDRSELTAAIRIAVLDSASTHSLITYKAWDEAFAELATESDAYGS